MRKNTRSALASFVAGEPSHPAESIWTDGKALYSYRTAIAARTPHDFDGPEGYVLNVESYSSTTSEKKNAARFYLGADNVLEVEGFGTGITGDTLQAAARAVDAGAVFDCGGCGSYHPEGFTGDCRQDDARLPFPPHGIPVVESV